MLSYRHAFHAGNYADVLKHCVLVQILRYLTSKDKPLCYLDTHAGTGFYRLTGAQAQQTGEFQQGIGALWHRGDLPAALVEYRECVRAAVGVHLTAYPGSPWLAQHILRPQDRLLLCELHPKDTVQLERTFGKASNVRCYAEDGWQKSLALLPPKERRGLVLIDPSYEVKDDYLRVVGHLKELHRKFATGVYALWYPVADASRTETMLRRLRKSGIARMQMFEVGLNRDHAQAGLTGAGMIVINAPWNLVDTMTPVLPFLAQLLGADAYWRMEPLTGE